MAGGKVFLHFVLINLQTGKQALKIKLITSEFQKVHDATMTGKREREKERKRERKGKEGL